jgi:hypothetical protein
MTLSSMNTIKDTFIMALFTTIVSSLQSCTNGWENLTEGELERKKYVVQFRSVSGYFSSTNRIEYRLRLGDLPYLPIDAQTTDWGVVYSTDIFGPDVFEYITTKDIQYTNTEEAVGARSFLYLSQKNVSKQEYEEYSRFFKSTEWQKADSICIRETRDSEPFPHIVGLVHGDPLKYRQDFKGMYLGQEYILRIENDGRVRLVDGGELGEVGTGLSPKVQMPDKVIYFSAEPGAITIDDLKGFKNKQGQSPIELFKFLPQ